MKFLSIANKQNACYSAYISFAWKRCHSIALHTWSNSIDNALYGMLAKQSMFIGLIWICLGNDRLDMPTFIYCLLGLWYKKDVQPSTWSIKTRLSMLNKLCWNFQKKALCIRCDMIKLFIDFIMKTYQANHFISWR